MSPNSVIHWQQRYYHLTSIRLIVQKIRQTKLRFDVPIEKPHFD